MLSVNSLAKDEFMEMYESVEYLKAEAKELDNGAMVIDAGVNVDGGYEAGRYLARICTAGLADIGFTTIESLPTPAIQVTTDHPVIACMASQYAGWCVEVGDYFAMGSGPARALSRKPEELYEEIKYEDDADIAVLILESSKIPTEEVTEKIARDCGVEPNELCVAVAPTSSIAGSVQVSARVVETGIHKLESLGFDINAIKHGSGFAPIAPIVGDDVKCMGSTNDCIIYGGRTSYVVSYDPYRLESFVGKVPSITSKDYGKPFYETFEEAGFDFYKVDAGMFAPAEISVCERSSGKNLRAGKVDYEMLLRSFGME